MLFSAWRQRTKAGLTPDWALRLPRRLTATSALPRSCVAGDLVLTWGPGLLLAVRASSGAVVYRKKLGPWRVAGFDAQGRLTLERSGARGRLDPASGAIEERFDAEVTPTVTAHDAADQPEQDPVLVVGGRAYRVRSETRSRVTRHWLEISEGTGGARVVEVAAFTLRTDRLTLTVRGERLYGAAGADPECPAGAVVGGAAGPVLILRRRRPAWHEHGIPVNEPDLVGHGPAHLGVLFVPEHGGEPRGRELGVATETWVGLGWRGGTRPPYMTKALGARPVGLAGGKIVLELTDLADGRSAAPGCLSPRRRFLAGFSAADLC